MRQMASLSLRVALCIVHTTSTVVLLRVVSDLEVEEVETLYHAIHVPLLSRTCGTSSMCRVWHSFVVRVETLAFIRNKK